MTKGKGATKILKIVEENLKNKKIGMYNCIYRVFYIHLELII